jgi:hypothetical protein
VLRNDLNQSRLDLKLKSLNTMTLFLGRFRFNLVLLQTNQSLTDTAPESEELGRNLLVKNLSPQS